MARVVLKFLNGTERTYYGGYSVYNGFVYVWAPGQRKGKQPIAKISLNELHSRKKTGQKGIFVYKT